MYNGRMMGVKVFKNYLNPANKEVPAKNVAGTSL
jgi:hypothetical protein